MASRPALFRNSSSVVICSNGTAMNAGWLNEGAKLQMRGERKATANSKESGSLTTARMILRSERERSEDSDLYRWAQLVVNRHEAGRSIADAEKWLGEIMAGMDMGYLEWESTAGPKAAKAKPKRNSKAHRLLKGK